MYDNKTKLSSYSSETKMTAGQKCVEVVPQRILLDQLLNLIIKHLNSARNDPLMRHRHSDLTGSTTTLNFFASLVRNASGMTFSFLGAQLTKFFGSTQVLLPSSLDTASAVIQQ